jgi:hypothetical protein
MMRGDGAAAPRRWQEENVALREEIDETSMFDEIVGRAAQEFDQLAMESGHPSGDWDFVC